MALGFPTARISVETPEQTLMTAFADYQGGIETMLRQHMDKLIHDGEIAKMAIKALEQRLPRYIEDQVTSAMFELELGKYIRPILVAAFEAILKDRSP